MLLSILDQSPVPAGTTARHALMNSIDLARHAERLGYNRYWAAEHHGLDTLAGTTPEILITRVACETRHIRVGTGGVLLTHYSPLKVAETFAVIHALSPGRIDLGVGRAIGGSLREKQLLSVTGAAAAPGNDFFEKILSLREHLAPNLGNPVGALIASSDAPPPRVWALGAGPSSASLAGQHSLPFAFAHFLRPESASDALAAYRRDYVPSDTEPEPKVLIAISAVCAPSRAEAHELALTSRAVQRRMRLDLTGPVPSVEDARAELSADGTPHAEDLRQPHFVGTPADLRDGIHELVESLDVDEIMINTVLHDHESRVRSYALLAAYLGTEK